jgi:hypothetical protein
MGSVSPSFRTIPKDIRDQIDASCSAQERQARWSGSESAAILINGWRNQRLIVKGATGGLS